VKGQVISGLYTGKLKPGDRLPSVREMSTHAGINLKSAQRIYQKLSQENYVDVRRASGVFVRERDPQTYERMRRKAIHKLIADTLEKARGLGLSPEKLQGLIENFSTGKNLRRIVVTVVDHEEEANIFSSEIRERAAPAEVYVFSLGAGDTNASPRRREERETVERESGRAGESGRVGEWESGRVGDKRAALSSELVEALQKSEYLMTTSWHMDEVKELATRFQKPVLEIRPNPLISAEILEAARTRNVALIVRDEHTMHAPWDVHMTIFHPSTDKKFFICPIGNKRLLEEILKEAETIYVTPACWDQMRKVTPANVELKTYQSFISDDTIATIREIQLYD